MSITLDHAASTPIHPEVRTAMEPWLWERCGNPSSLHSAGRAARRAIDESRRTIAELLGCEPTEIVFTSGGTESVNLALQGIMRRANSGHLVTSAIEHPAVIETVQSLEADGFAATVVAPSSAGVVAPEAVAAAITDATQFVSVIAASNELGTIQPFADIATAVKAVHAEAIIHTDACQAVPWLPVRVQEWGVDLLSASAAKFGGPAGAGLLYCKEGLPLKPLFFGGPQERRRRPGSEAVALIVGMAKALEITRQQLNDTTRRVSALRDQLAKGIVQTIPNTQWNGQGSTLLPSIANITFRGIDGDVLLVHLDEAGIAASLGSACAAGSVEPSHVLKAIGLSDQDAKSSLRFSLGHTTMKEEIVEVLRRLPEIVERLRA